MDYGHLGNLLGGLGQLIAALVALMGFGVATVKRQAILGWFATNAQLNRTIASLNIQLLDANRRAIAAEQRAANWESGAEGAKFSADEILARLTVVEQEAKEAKTLIPKFNALVDFTKRLLRHAVELEAQLLAAGHEPSSTLPSVPGILADKLMGDM